MNIDKRWFLLLTVVAAAVAGAAVLNSRRRQRRLARHLERRTDLKAWENEGGNLAPTPVAAILQ